MSLETQIALKRATAKGLMEAYGVDPYLLTPDEINDLINKLMFFRFPMDLDNL